MTLFYVFWHIFEMQKGEVAMQQCLLISDSLI